MRRIGLAVVLSVSLLTSQHIADAQQAGKVPRVGFLTAFASSDIPLWREGFRQGLRDLGYREGQNIVVEYRYADGHPDRLPALASELVGLKMDVIAAETTPASLALKQATGTIPIVMTIVADPTKSGLVASLARPEGNITGMSLQLPDLSAKRLQLLREITSTRAGWCSLEFDQSDNVASIRSDGGGGPDPGDSAGKAGGPRS